MFHFIADEYENIPFCPLYTFGCSDISDENVIGPEENYSPPKLVKGKSSQRGRTPEETAVLIIPFLCKVNIEASLSSASGEGTMPKEHRKHQFREKSEKSEIAATAQEIIQSPCSYFGRQREK